MSDDAPRDEVESASDIETVILKSPKPEGSDVPTVVEAARAIGSVGLDILEPVGTILEDQATRMEGWRSFVKDIDSAYLRLLLILDGAASLSLIACVLLFRFPDPVMWFLMELLVGLTLLRYIRSSVSGQSLARWLRGTGTGLLSGLWAVLIYNRIGIAPMFGAETSGLSSELSILWVPAVLHGLVALGVWVHLPLKLKIGKSYEDF
jgi:hypothetical protein